MIEKLKIWGLKDIQMFPQNFDEKTLPGFLSMHKDTVLVLHTSYIDPKWKRIDIIKQII